ncbi:hypothetical protein CVO_06060 [Sulfurimonas sp. CVO]|uniref:hypothetical protein n=1 Tax=Sulfurimonas sp. CVO TaxID=2283483 RepID=UPI00132EF6D6|nr:hypothetical protein [Sulfurimonas sp. CVO]QHG91424.1 hypothetical protein CVO_06060 [Sulfurimonas sp. CVO]
MYQKINSETIERAKRVNELGICVVPPLNLFYYYSILYSAECSFKAFEFYESLLTHKDVDPIQLVGAVQEAISHAGNLSFYFWNNGNSKMKKEIKEYIQNRSSSLRKDFNLKDDSPLKNRNLRNTFEHFDEKVDIFLINNIAGTFIPMPIIGKHTDLEEQQLNKNFKLLDIQDKCLVLLNNKFFFEDIQNEVIKIYDSAQKMVKKHG